jgi:LPPG:FO 2-phospho-L-lactate transferase
LLDSDPKPKSSSEVLPTSVIALTGGVGGAKLALGLHRIIAPGEFMAVCNTGDDFCHLGLEISPDIDTVLYTLSGLADPSRGWGRRNETWNFMAALEEIGGHTWFQLGDQDLATHIERTKRLAEGETLSTITDYFRRQLGIATRIVPMSDNPVRTQLRTTMGWMDFQDYFVRQNCDPVVKEITFNNAEAAHIAPAILPALNDSHLQAVVICPSNPLISIDPILAVPGMRKALRSCTAPVIGVSPIINGQAVRGPTAKLMEELGFKPSASEVAQRYTDVIDIWIVDESDADTCVPMGVKKIVTETLMTTIKDREKLAQNVLAAVQ